MSLKSDVRLIIGLFAIQIIFLLFGGYFVLRDSYFLGAIFLISIVPLFIFTRVKGKRMKEEYPEEYE